MLEEPPTLLLNPVEDAPEAPPDAPMDDDTAREVAELVPADEEIATLELLLRLVPLFPLPLARLLLPPLLLPPAEDEPTTPDVELPPVLEDDDDVLSPSTGA